MRLLTLAAMMSLAVCRCCGCLGVSLMGVTVLVVAFMGGSSVLNGLAVFAHKHALALAHASRGGKCKERGISHP
jgi:hypothetical protein